MREKHQSIDRSIDWSIRRNNSIIRFDCLFFIYVCAKQRFTTQTIIKFIFHSNRSALALTFSLDLHWIIQHLQMDYSFWIVHLNQLKWWKHWLVMEWLKCYVMKARWPIFYVNLLWVNIQKRHLCKRITFNRLNRSMLITYHYFYIRVYHGTS